LAVLANLSATEKAHEVQILAKSEELLIAAQESLESVGVDSAYFAILAVTLSQHAKVLVAARPVLQRFEEPLIAGLQSFFEK